ncbi:helix-turn-helix domain-containing protein [Lysinibacillus fusiformis]|uniref:helix-turn-helix domain-containing protein n=1 Tax=Lysinibacillus fusiformis TaxID=28031 RepID=UPI003D03B925
MNNLGAKLKQLRKDKNLTLVKVSELTGISQPYLSQIEADKKNPSAVYLHKLADVLEVPYSSLIKLTGRPEFIEKYNEQFAEQSKATQFVSQVVPVDTVRLEALEASKELSLLLGKHSINLKAENIKPTLNGNELTEEECERALAMLHLLFPHYS